MGKIKKGSLICAGALLTCLNFSVANTQELIREPSADVNNLELRVDCPTGVENKANDIVRHLRYITTGLSQDEYYKGNTFTYKCHSGNSIAYVPIGNGVTFFISLDNSDELGVGLTKTYLIRDLLLDPTIYADIFFEDQDNNYGKVDYVYISVPHKAYGWEIENLDDSKKSQIQDLYEKTINLFHDCEIHSIRSNYLKNIETIEKFTEEYKKINEEFKKFADESKKEIEIEYK